MGHAKSARWKGIGLAFPTDHKTTLEAIHWVRMAAKEDTQTITILIVNYNDWTSQHLPLNVDAGIHTIATIPPHIIHYDPTPEWPKYYQYIEPSLTSIICIHNQKYPTMNIQTPHELQNVLKKTLNTHIDTFPIIPNLRHYNVKFSKAWKNAPKTNPPPSRTLVQHPYPPYITTFIHLNFNHNNAYIRTCH